MINIIFLGYRHDQRAYLNLNSILPYLKIDTVILSVAYGGSDSAFIKYIGDICARNPRNYRYFIDPDPMTRLEWSLGIKSRWVLFVSDDDCFTCNHIAAILNASQTADCHELNVVNILPNLIVLNNSKSLEVFQPEILIDNDPWNRVEKFLNIKHVGQRYYSMHRYESFNEVLIPQIRLKLARSYIDQLLVLNSAINGKSIRAKELSVLVYDNTNWDGRRASMVSDLRTYRKPLSILLHELYWMRDQIIILEKIKGTLVCLNPLVKYFTRRSWKSVSLIKERVSAVKEIDHQGVEKAEEVIGSVWRQLNENPSTWGELRTILDFNSTGEMDIDPVTPYSIYTENL